METTADQDGQSSPSPILPEKSDLANLGDEKTIPLYEQLRTFKRSAAARDAKSLYSRSSVNTRSFNRTRSEKKKLKSRKARARMRYSVHDPFMEWVLSSAKKKVQKKFRNRKFNNQNRNKNPYEMRQSDRRGRNTLTENKQSGDPTRGTLVITRFYDPETGRIDLLLQKDREDSGMPKSNWGFVIGGAESKEETDEQCGLRECHEETGIPTDVGVLGYVDHLAIDIRPGAEYGVTGFVKTVPFNTPTVPGKEIYVEDGKPCQFRISKEELIILRETGALADMLLRKHYILLDAAISKNMI